MNKIRVNAFVTDECYKFIQETSQELGLSVSGFINLCVNQYKQQSIALATMKNFEEYITRLEIMQKKQQNNDMYSIQNRVNR